MKTQEDFEKELAVGESTIGSDGLRETHVAIVEIYNRGKRLKESFQILSNGTRRDRDIWGVAEKFKPGESPRQAALRGIREELGWLYFILCALVFPQRPRRTYTEVKESKSYPGQLTRYYKYEFEVRLWWFHHPIRYREADGKVNFFVWE